MQFLYPWVLWFSFLAVIPIIIHLFYFRRYKIEYFSQTELLENIVKQSRSQQKLRNLIILLLRILFILFLVFAFSQPYIKQGQADGKTSTNIYAIYIDNTFSMNDEGKSSISLIEEAKSKATAFIQSLPNNTRYLLYYHGMKFPADKILSSEEIQKKISEIHVSPISNQWSEIFSIFKRSIKQHSVSNNVPLVWFTDGQRYAIDYPLWEKDSFDMYLFHQLPAKFSNISIDSLWFDVPQHFIHQKEKLWVKVTNHGENDINALPLKLYINDTLKAVVSINLTNKSNQKISFDYINTKNGWYNGKVEISDFPITFDNTFYFSYEVYKAIKVAVISDNIPSYLVSFFKSDSVFIPHYYTWNNISISALSDKHAIVLHHTNNIPSGIWKELAKLVKKGHTLVFIPSATLQVDEVNSLFNELGVSFSAKDTSRWNLSISSYEQEFFKGMFYKKEERVKMPWVKLKYPIRTFANLPYDVILTYENGQIATLQVKYEKGKMYFFGFPIHPENSNFYSHPLFVSVFYRIFQQSLWTPDMYYMLNPNVSISVTLDTIKSEKPFELKNFKNQSVHIPLQQIRLGELIAMPMIQDMEDGIYSLTQNGKTITNLAFNYSRKESETNFYTTDEIIKILKTNGNNVKTFDSEDVNILKQEISQESKGVQLWKWLVLLSVLMLLLEMAIIRFWKVV